jgi:secreted PhoX family phosphatase
MVGLLEPVMPEHIDTPLISRRLLLRGSTAALVLSTLGCTGRKLAEAGASKRAVNGYGRLIAVADRNTGLPLLRLPEGFEYTSFGWAGESLGPGIACPGKHDGMGVVAEREGIVTLVRNHELGEEPGGSFAPSDGTYNPEVRGGTVTLRFDTRSGTFVDMQPSLSGTLLNCAGGSTPWGTWLTCEEVVLDEGQTVRLSSGADYRMRRSHGFIFEVPAEGLARPEPLLEMGQMRHEAAAVDPTSGIVYLTEDQKPAGFYRYIPNVPGHLAKGGRLEMLAVAGVPDLRTGRRAGESNAVRWVPINEPTKGMGPKGDGRGVVSQGLTQGGSMFTRLEGIVFGDDRVYFTATDGGNARCGQVWAYHPQAERLELVFESPAPDVLDYPDNITLSPRGGLVICEDSAQPVQRLYGMDRDGGLFEFCRNNVRLEGQQGFTGDFRGDEWAGVCFSPDGRWLFANIYTPGITVAITGPWRDGLI